MNVAACLASAAEGAPALGPALRAAIAPARGGALPWWLFRVLAR